MCVVFWTLEHRDYALILCTNRDEFLERPTYDARFHSFDPVDASSSGRVLSGIDELAGGTWFGLNRAGRVALLTNITEPPRILSTSRGSLVSSFLLSDSQHPLEDEVGKIIPRDANFAGFNLLLLAPAWSATNVLRFGASKVTNGGAGGALTSRPLRPEERSCGGFSNGVDGKGGEEWPKVKHGTREFASVLQSCSEEIDEPQLIDRLFEVLSWRAPETVTERSHLRNTIHVHPISIPLEPGSTHGPSVYGTRLSTILLVRRDGQVIFVERDIWKLVDGKVTKADPSSERVFRFHLTREPTQLS